MALSINQMITASYTEVLAEMRKPTNNWAESAFMREMERQGAIKKINGSPVIGAQLDYQRNQGAEFQTNDLDGVATSKTEVLTEAQYASAQLVVPIVWSKKDEAENSSPNQKIALVKSLLENAINSHDDVIEQALFASSTSGFNGLPTIVPTGGQGTVGGIDASVETWWRNYSSTYLANYSDLTAKFTAAYNSASKGSGAQLAPKFMVSGATLHAQYEASQQTLVRYVDTREADAGFKILAFKTARYVFSQYAPAVASGTGDVWFLNPKSFQLAVVKQAFRLMGDVQEFTDASGYIRKIFTLAQCITDNKSRLACLQSA